MLRYSEVLLNYAEAKNKLGSSDEALDKLNMVHQRAGLPALDNMGQDKLDEAIFRKEDGNSSAKQNYIMMNYVQTA